MVLFDESLIRMESLFFGENGLNHYPQIVSEYEKTNLWNQTIIQI